VKKKRKVVLFVAMLSVCAMSQAPVIFATPTGFDCDESLDTSPGAKASTFAKASADRSDDTRDERYRAMQTKKIEATKQPQNPAIHPECDTKCRVSRDEKALFDCPICFEQHKICETQEFGCCKMRVCKHCYQELVKGSDMKEKSDPIGTAHPESIAYALDLTYEAFDRTLRYQNATPKSEPKWGWHKVGKHYYFLEGGTLWRYAHEEAPDDADEETLYSGPWRYITPPRCPFCYKCQRRGLPCQHNHG
jgi:hypothetical protein